MGRTTFITLALRDGEAVAHSDLYVLADETVAHQMDTLVRRDHRGHRLGTAVKVTNLAALTRARPDVRHAGRGEPDVPARRGCYSFLSRTNRTEWSAALRSTSVARPRVGCTFSFRFGPLTSSQIRFASSTASDSVSAP